MMQADVAVLLALANGHDQRHGIDDVKVQAWHSLFQQEAPDMPREWAVERINFHYARSTEMLMPAHLVTMWKQKKRTEAERVSLPTGEAVPMPEWFKQQVKGMK
jgi:hypothetical protein